MPRLLLTIITGVIITTFSSASAVDKKQTTTHKRKTSHSKTKLPRHVLSDPNWLMLDHVEAVFKIMNADKGKCDKTLKDVISYVNEHKITLVALRKKARENKSSLCPKAKKRADASILSRAEKLGDKYGSMMFDYYKKCPGQSEDLIKAMQILGSKCKQSQ